MTHGPGPIAVAAARPLSATVAAARAAGTAPLAPPSEIVQRTPVRAPAAPKTPDEAVGPAPREAAGAEDVDTSAADAAATATRIMQREPLPFDLLADPDYEPDDDQDPTQLALAVLTDLLHLMRVDADVASREPETPMDGLNHAVAVLDVTATRDGGALDGLIGRHGEHLAACSTSSI